MTTHLAQECTTLAWMWKIVRTDGVEFYFTSFDQDLPFGGHTYISKAGFSPTAIQNKSDLSVDNQELSGVFDDASITVADLRAGLFDYAELYIFLVNWANADGDGAINLRRAKLGETTSSPQGYFKAEVRGLMQLLQQVVVEIFGPSCRADLFDSRCTLQKALFECTATVNVVTDSTHFTVNSLVTPSAPYYVSNDGWFQYGVLQFTSGLNNGRALEIKTWNHTTNAIQLYLPAGYTIAPGDTLKLLPGCDKTLATCRDKFLNLLNMRAEPYIPGNDQVFIYADANGGGF